MKKKKVRKFTVVFEKAKEGGYVVSVPILPGCVSQGETFEEAERMIKDAIKCYCESLIKHDEPIPKEVSEKLTDSDRFERIQTDKPSKSKFPSASATIRLHPFSEIS